MGHRLTPIDNVGQRHEFAAFLDRLVAAKGRVPLPDWDRYIVAHYGDEEIEEIRRTIVRLQHSWAYRDWPGLNLDLATSWAKRLRDNGE